MINGHSIWMTSWIWTFVGQISPEKLTNSQIILQSFRITQQLHMYAFLMCCALLYKVVFYIQLLIILLAVFRALPIYISQEFWSIIWKQWLWSQHTLLWVVCNNYVDILSLYPCCLHFSLLCVGVISCTICGVIPVPGPPSLDSSCFTAATHL